MTERQSRQSCRMRSPSGMSMPQRPHGCFGRCLVSPRDGEGGAWTGAAFGVMGGRVPSLRAFE
ncbi:hypothetical protein XM48_16500 [Leucobacter sp. Ag1]|nr:hypothetical protein XM48_16500 [Leucobacter sp. Ag1]